MLASNPIELLMIVPLSTSKPLSSRNKPAPTFGQNDTRKLSIKPHLTALAAVRCCNVEPICRPRACTTSPNLHPLLYTMIKAITKTTLIKHLCYLILFSLPFISCSTNCTPAEAPKNCAFIPYAGNVHCWGIIPSFYYDQEIGECLAFNYGGCNDTGLEPFRTKEECEVCTCLN